MKVGKKLSPRKEVSKMAETFLTILIAIIFWAIVLAILYFVVKKAVKNGILEAKQEIQDPPPKVEYPIQIDEEHPDLPFNK